MVGEATAEMRDRFTRVLKGHIALATARFPDGTIGMQLDSFARRPLWEAGLDYDHGTGHGVGSYLSVHEGPQNISKRPVMQALKPGMVCSNEPGFYKTGAFGIRIENLVVVTEPEDLGGERPMMGFETITLVPIDLNLVESVAADRCRARLAEPLSCAGARHDSARWWMTTRANGWTGRRGRFNAGRKGRNMMRFRVIAGLLLLTAGAALAQGDAAAGFQGLFIHDQCIGENTEQPDTCLHDAGA